MFPIFWIALAALYFYIAIILWSLLTPHRRIWPTEGVAWKMALFWGLFYIIIGLSAAVALLDWNRWVTPLALRFGLGIPLTLLGLGVLYWGVRTLGMKNTHGERDQFILSGPYRFTRNPQYLGDILMLAGGTLVVNSLYLTVLGALIILSFLLLPIPEEIWLERHYGENYRRYKMQTPRFL